MTARALLSHLDGVKKQGDGWMALCPAHEDRNPSLRISEGDGGVTLLKCFAGCDAEAVVAAMGLTMADLFAERRNGNGNGRVIEATYDYWDEDRNLQFQVIRYNPKDFRQRRPHGAGKWIYNLEGVRRVLYRLPELLAADPALPVFLVEGEKDVDRLVAGGLVATCSPMGAGKWRQEYANSLVGRHVVIIPDNDQQGRSHAQAEAKSLAGVASSVKMLTLSGLPDKGDVSDWLDAGHTIEELKALAESAPGADDQPKAEHAKLSTPWVDFDAEEFPPGERIAFAVERGEIALLNSLPNAGKTTLALNVALCLAAGREFPPLVAKQAPRRVLYIDGETTRRRLQRDLRTMTKGFSREEAIAVGQNLHVICEGEIKGDPLALTNTAHLLALSAEAVDLKPDFIVVDTLASLCPLYSENDNGEQGRKIWRPLQKLARDCGAAMLVNHHVGKRSEDNQTPERVYRGRGASASGGAARAVWLLIPDASTPGVVKLSCAKAKGDTPADVTLQHNPKTRWLSSPQAAPAPLTPYQQVVETFNGKPLKRADVQKLLPNISKTTLGDCLKKAVELGDLVSPTYGIYQKPNLPDLPETIGGGKSGNSGQPVEPVEDGELFDGELEIDDDGDLRHYPDTYDDREVGA